MTKVEMDVIRPWIATRVTELLGFEDEVLINFIYGLLDGKVIVFFPPISFVSPVMSVYCNNLTWLKSVLPAWGSKLQDILLVS